MLFGHFVSGCSLRIPSDNFDSQVEGELDDLEEHDEGHSHPQAERAAQIGQERVQGVLLLLVNGHDVQRLVIDGGLQQIFLYHFQSAQQFVVRDLCSFYAYEF